jgi:hypothetical protein
MFRKSMTKRAEAVVHLACVGLNGQFQPYVDAERGEIWINIYLHGLRRSYRRPGEVKPVK